jgi:hypothetical protein
MSVDGEFLPQSDAQDCLVARGTVLEGHYWPEPVPVLPAEIHNCSHLHLLGASLACAWPKLTTKPIGFKISRIPRGIWSKRRLGTVFSSAGGSK